MSLRTDFSGTRDIKIAEARVAGRTWVVTDNITSLQTEMAAAANQGSKSFKIELPVNYQTQDLRVLGPLWGAFKTGVVEGFADQDIMMDESEISLNTDDNVNTFITIDFNF